MVEDSDAVLVSDRLPNAGKPRTAGCAGEEILLLIPRRCRLRELPHHPNRICLWTTGGV